ncbi:MAG: hypothetical protein IJU51_03030, partial [Clostridia bacterium]|nr:hypothetical protein [Clostridia bacterium]
DRPISTFLKGVVAIKRRIILSILAVCMLVTVIFSTAAYAASPVTPRTSFSYRGTDITASVESKYRDTRAFFKDEAEILPDNAEREIWEKLQSTADYLNLNIAIFIGGNYRTDDETVNFTNECISALFGSSSDTVFIYLDFEGYSPAYDYIRTSNNADTIFTDTKRNRILNTMYQKLPKSSEPIYPDSVKLGVLNGIEEIKTQGYVNNYQHTNTYDNANNTYDDYAPPPRKNNNISFNEVSSFFSKIPSWLIFGVIGFIVLIIVISAISKSIKRHTRNFTNYNSNNYYDDNSYYGNRNGYYGRGSSYHHSSYRRPPRSHSHHSPPPPPPPRSSRSHSSSSNHSGSSNHSSGSGHYR